MEVGGYRSVSTEATSMRNSFSPPSPPAAAACGAFFSSSRGRETSISQSKTQIKASRSLSVLPPFRFFSSLVLLRLLPCDGWVGCCWVASGRGFYLVPRSVDVGPAPMIGEVVWVTEPRQLGWVGIRFPALPFSELRFLPPATPT
ncbi:hypothetical protein BHE74_00034118 [Ensete ventricosum]|nr:hypothetical protein GW17_00029539 [Ensete ventricosum]RWW58988.1 hypothetical protein BHE74_00034118 [Ensete ventricosum]RZS10912.1 hypothetical protein BHM03_00042189 [Ensete ventricosum]